jgi:tRNA(Ile)-lysidine synthase
MVLLHVLAALAPQNRWRLSVAHFNHQLRGAAAVADEKLVRRAAKELGLPFHGGRGDVKAFAACSKISIEMAARKLRHEFLARTAREQKISVVALAHHADDQVELFFLRWLRGAGGEGLAGMKRRSPSPADKKITLVRPLLGMAKNELAAFAREHKIAFREDASNQSADFLRNRIRNQLLPLLQKDYQPGVARTVLRLMEIVGAEAEYVGEVARQFRASGASKNFDSLPMAVQRRVLQQRLAAAGVVGDFELVEQLRETTGKPISIGARLTAARDVAGNIHLRECSQDEFNVSELKVHVTSRAGRVDFGGKQFGWTIKKSQRVPKYQTGPKSSGDKSIQGMEFFDADQVGGEIILRHWQPGDRFQPIGMRAAVKLQDLFVNAKIPAARRRHLVLGTTAEGAIFWVEGLRIGEPFKLTQATRRRLAWTWSDPRMDGKSGQGGQKVGKGGQMGKKEPKKPI